MRKYKWLVLSIIVYEVVILGCSLFQHDDDEGLWMFIILGVVLPFIVFAIPQLHKA